MMEQTTIPEIFRQLMSEGCLKASDILQTQDGFRLAYKSLSHILSEKGITEFLDSEGRMLKCDRFYDDWFLYAVPDGTDHAYGLLKFREQEHDREDGSPADGDHPGVTISFISFACEVLLACITDPSSENRTRLDGEINRVVARKGQRHYSALKTYFKDPRSHGAYLVAGTYTRHIALFAENGRLALPEYYKEILQQSNVRKNTGKPARIPRFIEELNRTSGRIVCDHENIYIEDREAPSTYEAAAILATHTGNTSVFSFAAEVEYHARFLTPLARIRIPLYGRSLYESAIRADMTVYDTEYEGPAPFYKDNAKIVKRQYALHQSYRF